MKRLGSFLLCFLPFLIAESIQIIAATLFTFVYMMIDVIGYLLNKDDGLKVNFTDYTSEIEQKLSGMGNETYIISMLAIITSGVLFFFWYRKINKKEQWFIVAKYRVDIINLIILGISAQLLVTGILSLLQPYFQKAFEEYGGNVDRLLGASPILVISFTVVIAPVVEELIFRGVIMSKLGKEVSFMGANLLQAALFGIYHLNLVQGLYAFFLGLILGYTAKKYKTLLAAIILHSIINGMAFVVGFLGSSMLNYIVYLCVGGVGVIYSIMIMRKVD